MTSRTHNSDRLVLAVDCSTTASKAIVIDAVGEVLGAGATGLVTSSPAPGWNEQDARDWWSATDTAVRQALAQVPDRRRVAAVCFTHQRESFVCVDANGDPLRAAILWMDSRAGAQVERFGSRRVEELTGKPADTTPALYKLAWLREHEPELLEKTHQVLDVHAFLVRASTGQWVTSTSSADPLGLVDVSSRQYSAELLAIAGLRRDQVCEQVPTGEVIAPLTPEVADGWGLLRDTVVVAGLGDGQAAGLGAGVTQPGQVYINLGTAVVIGTESRGYVPSRAYRSLVSAVPGGTTLETFSSSGTFLPSWFRREFGRPELQGQPDPELDAAAAAVPAGSEGLLTLPHWHGAQTPHWDAQTSGAVLGWRGWHTRAHFYRSLLEGITFELRLQLDGLEAATGVGVDVIRTMGGGTRSPLWRQLLADVLGRPIQRCATDETSALGAAAVALTSIGAYADVASAATSLASPEAPIAPRAEVSAQYAGPLATYRHLYENLRPVLRTLHH
jgi:xylulokinase